MTCLLGRMPHLAGMNKWSAFAGRMTFAKMTPMKKTVAHLSCRAPLLHFPSRLVYIAPCRCWKLQEFVDLNPRDWEIKGTLNVPSDYSGNLSDDFTDIGEAFVAKDGLIHPDDSCGYTLSSG